MGICSDSEYEGSRNAMQRFTCAGRGSPLFLEKGYTSLLAIKVPMLTMRQPYPENSYSNSMGNTTGRHSEWTTPVAR